MNEISQMKELHKFGSILGLERIKNLMEKLGNPQDSFKTIHVAGTNGKGSTSHFLSSILIEGGLKVGLYTSPFLEKFNDRIRINGKQITDEEIDKYSKIVMSKVREMAREGYEIPTEFDAITAMAFLYFKEQKVDWLILEVGLGGSKDSTNIVAEKLASVFTPISMDHQDRLGETLEEIARDKSGIVRRETPVIFNKEPYLVRDILKREAEQCDCEYIDLTECIDSEAVATKEGNFVTYELTKFPLHLKGETLDLKNNIFEALNLDEEKFSIEASMLGTFQIENMTLALGTILYLVGTKKLQISFDAIKLGIKKAHNKGRFEILKKEPYTVIIDGAHNVSGAEALKDTVKQLFPKQDILMVVAILKDKDMEGILDEFLQITDHFIVTEVKGDRKLEKEVISDYLLEKGANVIIEPSVKGAIDTIEYAVTGRGNPPVILFAGSLYMIGEARKLVLERR